MAKKRRTARAAAPALVPVFVEEDEVSIQYSIGNRIPSLCCYTSPRKLINKLHVQEAAATAAAEATAAAAARHGAAARPEQKAAARRELLRRRTCAANTHCTSAPLDFQLAVEEYGRILNDVDREAQVTDDLLMLLKLKVIYGIAGQVRWLEGGPITAQP